MLIVSIGAGLGNQMYEYAFYEYLKDKFPKTDVKVDLRYAFPLAHNGIEVFEVFGIEAPIATKEEVLSVAKGFALNGEGFERKNIIERILRKLGRYPKSMLVQKDYTEYYDFAERVDVNKSYYFYGPFANYRYFDKIGSRIKELYLFPEISDERNRMYAKAISGGNSVSIHIRKGDYVDEGIELIPAEFYKKAMNVIEDRIGEAEYFVFSDEVEYAKALLGNRNNCIFIEGNIGVNSFRDMQLMAMCKHNITANSTFSFWGAYLNSNLNKIVISPHTPFTGMKNTFTCDDWILL